METPQSDQGVKCQVACVRGAGYFVAFNGVKTCNGVQRHTARMELMWDGDLTRKQAEKLLDQASTHPRRAGEFPTRETHWFTFENPNGTTWARYMAMTQKFDGPNSQGTKGN